MNRTPRLLIGALLAAATVAPRAARPCTPAELNGTGPDLPRAAAAADLPALDVQVSRTPEDRTFAPSCGGEACTNGDLVTFRVDDVAPGLAVGTSSTALYLNLGASSGASRTFQIFAPELPSDALFVATYDEDGYRTRPTRVRVPRPD